MHGVIFSQLKKYVTAKHGFEAWQKLLEKAGRKNKFYLVTQEYPDAEMVELVTAASEMLNASPTAILEDFGEFIVPDLFDLYKTLIKPQWRTLDFIMNTEENIHKIVRVRTDGAKPPELVCDRTASNEVTVTYSSHRRLCAVAKGIARGVAKHYKEPVSIFESECMHKGAKACRISVRLV